MLILFLDVLLSLPPSLVVSTGRGVVHWSLHSEVSCYRSSQGSWKGARLMYIPRIFVRCSSAYSYYCGRYTQAISGMHCSYSLLCV